MAKYLVHKYFGHFWQCWKVEADSEKAAWKNAERDGELQYQSVYKEPKDLESKGHVVNLTEKKEEHTVISTETYYAWMKEAIEKGMIVTQEEYEKALGLPFRDVW